MKKHQPTRREVLRSLAVLPATALLLRPGGAVAQASKIVVFNGVAPTPTPGVDLHYFGWAAETPQGWIGRITDGPVSVAMRDFARFAAGMTAVVPKGMANTINGHMDKDGVPAAGVCFADITGGSVMGSTIKFTGKLTDTEHPVLNRPGDPVSMDGNKDKGDLTYTIRGGGRDIIYKGKGLILMS